MISTLTRRAALALALLPAFATLAFGGDRVVVCNRADGTLSVIDTATDTVSQTIALPPGTAAPEPMYVVAAADKVCVGDRANDRVVVYERGDLSLAGTVSVGAGVFHMWADPLGLRVWVVGDIDQVLTAVDPKTLTVAAQIPVPADLVAMGGKPHDIVASHREVYVSIVGLAGASDAIVQFSAITLAELGRHFVGKDPHLAMVPTNPLLFSPTQDANLVNVFDRGSLTPLAQLPIPAAHGAWMRPDGRVFYATNISGGGPAGLWAIDAVGMKILGVADTPFATPHNVTGTGDGKKLYVTHSGSSAAEVSVYETAPGSAIPVHTKNLVAGLNPFGIAAID